MVRRNGPRVATCWAFAAAVLCGCGDGTVALTRPSPPPTPFGAPTPDTIFVGNSQAGISVYSSAQSGSVAPLQTLRGEVPVGADKAGVWALDKELTSFPDTNLQSPYAGAVRLSLGGEILNTVAFEPDGGYPVGGTAGATDSAGNLYVAQGRISYYPSSFCEFRANAEIAEYAANSSSSKPIRVIATPQYCSIFSIAVDRAAHVWVAGDTVGGGEPGDLPLITSIAEYGARAVGSAAPLRALQVGIGTPCKIAVDSSGNLYELGSGNLSRYDPQTNFSQIVLSNLNVGTAFLPFDGSNDVAVDAYGIVFVETANAQAGARVIEQFKLPRVTPIRTLTGPSAAIGGSGLTVLQ